MLPLPFLFAWVGSIIVIFSDIAQSLPISEEDQALVWEYFKTNPNVDTTIVCHLSFEGSYKAGCVPKLPVIGS